MWFVRDGENIQGTKIAASTMSEREKCNKIIKKRKMWRQFCDMFVPVEFGTLFLLLFSTHLQFPLFTFNKNSYYDHY